MAGKKQKNTEMIDSVSRDQYVYSGNARIRREALEDTADGADYYWDGINLLYTHGLSKDGSVLNVGSGDGTEEKRMALEFGHRGLLIGLDVPSTDNSFEDRFLASNDELKKHGKSNVAFLPGNALAIDFQKSTFDAVTWWHSGYHFPNKSLAIQQSLKALKVHGLFMNMTNGEQNKPLTHGAVANIKNLLGVSGHAPLSSGFQIEESRKMLRRFLRPLKDYDQFTDKYFDEENLWLFISMVDSYRSTVPESKAKNWTKAREEIIARTILPIIKEQGYITETVHRGGTVYEKLGPVPSWMGRIALAF